jgi:hypothetical protein
VVDVETATGQQTTIPCSLGSRSPHMSRCGLYWLNWDIVYFSLLILYSGDVTERERRPRFGDERCDTGTTYITMVIFGVDILVLDEIATRMKKRSQLDIYPH